MNHDWFEEKCNYCSYLTALESILDCVMAFDIDFFAECNSTEWSSDSVKLSWSATSGDVSYEISDITDRITITDVNTTAYTVSKLTSGSTVSPFEYVQLDTGMLPEVISTALLDTLQVQSLNSRQ